MQVSARTQELKNGFVSVLQGVVETGGIAEQIRPDIGLILNRNKIDVCLQQLDSYAEELHRLDRDLGEITHLTENLEEHFTNMRQYSALFALGASVHEALYKDYRILRALREKTNLLMVSAMIVSGAALSLLAMYFY